ncbi:MAG: bifunctional phosphoribosyl-AMP cyclohydrolase/phosphoribosyl-ATP diphosphatase HisIE [Clostridiales bacterium]|jgi:phosphoribosyl-ATP pyrophosphohydrolase/phosphoribosyl-AMP cyclohydrolase|nr:bifunctional phosphoribosyl-AMP cyclohydrolase/phosphoribosyl-ATP diphosphatase HisIE [Clostridiales bacterium]
MQYKRIIPFLNTEGEIGANITKLASEYSDRGADELLLYNFSKDENSGEEFLKLCKQIARSIDIPFIIGSYINDFEQAKKALYTGASGVLLPYSIFDKSKLVKDISSRFGESKIYLEIEQTDFMFKDNIYEQCKELGIGTLLINYIDDSEAFIDKISKAKLPIIIKDNLKSNDIRYLLEIPNVVGITTDFFINKDIMKAKQALKQENINVNVFESKHSWSELKQNYDGLIPVITQDYKTGEVLMLAYMNEEAYNRTITDGRMTYFSRSRNELWLKGESSGNYQYVKEIFLDCDNDTLLAKVIPAGPACHTGNKSCFYTSLIEKEFKKTNSYHILEDVYNVIMDRKKNPKEGSYTNYLFDKGIDKILKKCGEEAAEIIIAAKNPETGELRYEMADFLYHLMVLMVQSGLDWEDITTELLDRDMRE